MKAFIISGLVFIALTGCSIRFTSQNVRDGGVFRSSDNGESWQQRVFVRQEKKKVYTISDIGIAAIIPSPASPDELTITTYGNGVYRTTNDTEQWTQTSLGSGTHTAFAYDPQNPLIQYAATGSTLLKSSDSGVQWQTVYTETRGEQISAVAVDAYDPSRVYAATSGGTLLKSLNAGTDWTSLFDVDDTIHTIALLPRDTRTVYAATANKGIYRSTDGGATWTQLSALTQYGGAGQIRQLLLVAGTNRMYVATNYGVLSSDDGGTSWTPMKTLVPFGSVPVMTIAVDPRFPSTLYFSVNNLVHKSDDRGATWRTITAVSSRRIITALIASPTNDGVLYLGTRSVKK